MSEKLPQPKKKKKAGFLKMALAAGAVAAAGGSAAMLESKHQESLRLEAVDEHPEDLLAYYAKNLFALEAQDIPAVASAMKKMQNRQPVYEVFRSLLSRAELDAGAFDLMDKLEEEANLSASEILFLHRTEYLRASPDIRNTLFSEQQQAQRGESTPYDAAGAHIEEVFSVLRTHPELGTLEERAHMALLVARELSYAHTFTAPGYVEENGFTVTFATITEALRHIAEERERHAHDTIFNPTILAFYANEQALGTNVFGSEHLQGRLRQLAGEHYYEFRPQGTQSDKEGVAQALRRIEETPTPVTVLFDSHGGPEGLYLDQRGGASRENPTVSADALANEFVRRYREHPELRAQAEEHPDVIILSNCYGGNIVSHISSVLADKGLPVPMFLSSSEYNQIGYGLMDAHSYGSPLLDAMLSDIRTAPTLGSAVAADTLARPFSNSTFLTGDAMIIPARKTIRVTRANVYPLGPEVETVVTEREEQLSENETTDTALG